VLTVVLYFKFRMVGVASDLVVGQMPQAFVARLLTGSRYLMIGKAFVKQLTGFGGWPVTLPPMLLMYLLLTGISEAHKNRPAIYTGLLTLLLLTCGYFIVYLFTPYDLTYHVDSSLFRVLMQLWPLAIFTFFLLVRTLEEVAGEVSGQPPAGPIPLTKILHQQWL
jgi:hypothetical protein